MYLTQSGSRENSERNVNHHKNPSTKPDTKSDFRRNIEKSKEEIETIGFITTQTTTAHTEPLKCLYSTYSQALESKKIKSPNILVESQENNHGLKVSCVNSNFRLKQTPNIPRYYKNPSQKENGHIYNSSDIKKPNQHGIGTIGSKLKPVADSQPPKLLR